MVLQRDKPVPIWGWAPSGAEVAVEFAGRKVTATAGDDGRWRVDLEGLKACAEGRVLSIHSGSRVLEIKDVVVGEVWLCSGQSNMAFTMARAGYVPPSRRRKHPVRGGPKGIPEGFDPGKYPLIRQFLAAKVKQPSKVDPVEVGTWAPCSPETVQNFTAVGFFFAQRLYRELGVPIGLINCSKGSTRVEAWQTSGYMYQSQIRPILPQAIRGAIWYQGEHNAGDPDGYAGKLEALIAGWREAFGQGPFPFYIVQLPNFCEPNPDPAGGDGWARIREEQFRVTQDTPNTGLAVITDTGLVDSAHPYNKVDVGYRLAQWALAQDYGRTNLVPSGPVFRKMTVSDGKAVLAFDRVGSGLMVGRKEGLKPAGEVPGGKPDGFAIAGADRAWHWAEAQIDGDRVTVWDPQVPEPVAVRYGFSSNPVRGDLYNREGLPACPFRTDDWEIPRDVVRTLRGR